MGMGRSQDDRMGLMGQVDIVDEQAAPAQQSRVFLARYTLPYSEFFHRARPPNLK